jgi:sec-independent protein translocase protein TatA
MEFFFVLFFDEMHYPENSLGSMNIWHWLLVLLVVILTFGTNKLGHLGSNHGQAAKGFRGGVRGKQNGPAVPVGPLQVADKAIIDADANENDK